MNNELKQIKKKYGEKFSHLCRELFSTILENEGMLLEILTEHFEYNHFLYDDIVNKGFANSFKNYINNLYNEKLDTFYINEKEKITETPEELMDKAGYVLKECAKEEEIQSYKKYYAPGEELCTFTHGGRLKKCRVFFAVKKNISDIKRENFKNPRRQDEYGTSVISIQFTKDGTNTLSIKNRYNHTVANPDSTFSNDLDNIIAGLTESFENTYGIVQKYQGNNFEIPGYVLANDGKYYKYNYEINNIYYCPNNIIINNFEVKRYDKEKYIVLDYFILDLVNKRICLYDKKYKDSFIDGISDTIKINVLNEEKNKRIVLTPIDGENIEIVINDKNQIIGYKNNNLKKIKDHFLGLNSTLKVFECLNVEKIGNAFLANNRVIENIELPNLVEVGDLFLYLAWKLKNIWCPSLKKVGNSFLHSNESLYEFIAPNLEEVGNKFIYVNSYIKKFESPNLIKVGGDFLFWNKLIIQFIAPNLKIIGRNFLYFNERLKIIDCPNLNSLYSRYMNKHVCNLFSSKKNKVLIKLSRFCRKKSYF